MDTKTKKIEQLKKGQIIGAVGTILSIVPFLIKKGAINPTLALILTFSILLFGACFFICRGLLILYSDVLKINFIVFEGQGIPGFIKNLVGYCFLFLGSITAFVVFIMAITLPFGGS